MDQDSFRQLLQSSAPPKRSAAPSASYGSGPSKKQGKKVEPSQPAFKPRTVKKPNASNYRDRASERRQGIAGDYAQVEAIAEDFERRANELDRKTLEEQRQYLGGDADHTVLVKGLDFALLEQNKAKVMAEQNVEDDEALEQAFLEARGDDGPKEDTKSQASSKKRTREDLVRELKTKRAKKGDGEATGAEESVTDSVDEAAKLEEAKKAGKFRPIGFKPIGQEKSKKKVKKVKASSKATKAGTSVPSVPSATESQTAPPSNPPASTTRPPLPPQPEPEPVDEDFDIFAGAGEYTGVDLGSSSESDGEVRNDSTRKSRTPEPRPGTSKKWFDNDDDADRPLRRSSSRAKSKSRAPDGEEEEGEVQREPSPSRSPLRSRRSHSPDKADEEEDVPMRLQPLSSSVVPSIKDILAMDQEVEKAEKRKARKEKTKAKKLDKEGKVERDYQRLKSYTEKKSAGNKD